MTRSVRSDRGHWEVALVCYEGFPWATGKRIWQRSVTTSMRPRCAAGCNTLAATQQLTGSGQGPTRIDPVGMQSRPCRTRRYQQRP